VGRAAALLALGALVGTYYGVVGDLPHLSLWWAVAWVGLIVMPAVFALVGLLLPLWRSRGRELFAVGAACLAVAVVLGTTGHNLVANFAKLGAMTFLAWAFLTLFEDISWVVLVACIVPWVDIASVFRGPTKTIVTHHAKVFSAFSFAFPVPGGGAMRLGMPDLLFFGLFLAAAARFGLRVLWTWLALTLSFGATMALAIAWGPGHGLPALPLLSVGFLLPNADLIWARLRRRQTRIGDRADVAVDRPAHD
jgi:hypothetical protein